MTDMTLLGQAHICVEKLDQQVMVEAQEMFLLNPPTTDRIAGVPMTMG
jgi:hypothetical protein